MPYAVAALVESGRRPAALAALADRDLGNLAEEIDSVLATPDLDPEVRGPLALAGAYAYACFDSLMCGDLYSARQPRDGAADGGARCSSLSASCGCGSTPRRLPAHLTT